MPHDLPTNAQAHTRQKCCCEGMQVVKFYRPARQRVEAQSVPMASSPWGSLILFIIVTTCIQSCCCLQVMFLPLSERTHMLVHLKLATALEERGHTVTFITAGCHREFADKTLSQMAPNARLEFVEYSMDCSYHEAEKAAARLLSPLGEVRAIYRNVVGRIDDILSDEALMRQLSALAPQTDLLVSDVISLGMLLAAKLQLSHIDFDVGTAGALWEPVMYGAEPATSYIPAHGSFFPTSGMGLWQRAANLAMTTVIRTLVRAAFWHPNSSLQQVIAKHSIPIQWPYTQALMVLVNSNFATEPPRAIPPNIQYVGPILPEPAKQLPTDLQQFVADSGEAGTVLVSFGGTLQAPLAASKALVTAMAALQPVRFVWKLSKAHQEQLAAATDVKGLPNVYMSDWLPQNDLLGHPNVRAFVTQGGYLSMGEAAYHGVPVLGLPFIPGQAELIRFAHDQGRALYISTQQLEGGNVQPLVQALQQLLSDGRFHAAAQVVSRRLKAVKRPYKELAADWVEFAAAVKGDGPFLHPAKLQQQWWQQEMLDVYLLYSIAAVLVVLLGWHLHGVIASSSKRSRLRQQQYKQRGRASSMSGSRDSNQRAAGGQGSRKGAAVMLRAKVQIDRKGS